MCKKLLSLALVFCLLLSMASVIGASAEEAYTLSITEGAYELTSALEIIKYEKSDFNKTLTRGELAQVVCSLMNIPPYDAVSAFTDVSMDHPYARYINALYKSSVVSGSTSGIFEPDREVSFNEAITMVVRAIGYSAKAEYSGGYPTGYLMVAKQEKLLNGLTPTNGLITKGEMVQLCYNALESDAMAFIGVTNGEPVFGTSKGYTLGEYVFGLKHITGVVKAVDLSAVQGENDLRDGYILVDGVKIFAGAPILWEYLGYEADVWYAPNRKGINEFKYIKKSDYNRVTEIDLADIINVNKGVVEYYDEDGKKKSATYKIASPVIYNTVATYEAFNMDMLNIMDGGVIRLISNDGDKVSDVIFVEAYQDYVVSSISSYKLTLYDKFDSQRKIVLDTKADDPYTIIYDANGEEVAFGTIKVGDVLSVYASKNDADQKFIKAVKHTNVVEGEIKSISYLSDTAEITIGDATFKLTQRCFKNCKAVLEIGTSVTASLNLEGEISNLKTMSMGMNLVYLMGIAKEDEGFDKKYTIKVLNLDKTFSVYELAERVSVDEHIYENGYCDEKTILEALTASSKVLFPKPLVEDCVTQPVQLKVSGEGVVTYIDTMLTEKGTVATRDDVNKMDALYKVGSTQYSVSRRNGNNFGGVFLAPWDCPTITIPTPEDAEASLKIFDEDAYKISTAGIFTDRGTIFFVAHAFSTKDDTLFAECILTTLAGESFNERTQMSVVKSVRKALLPDGSEGYNITVIGKDSEPTLLIRSDMHFEVGDKEFTPADLKEGDVIRHITNANGEVGNNGIELLFSPQDKKVYREMKAWDINGNTQYLDSLHSNYPISWGYAYEVFQDTFTFAENILDLDKMAAFNTAALSMNPTGGTVVIYDPTEPEGRRLIYGTTNDIAGYKQVKTDCSFVFYTGESTRVHLMLIINGYDLTE